MSQKTTSLDEALFLLFERKDTKRFLEFFKKWLVRQSHLQSEEEKEYFAKYDIFSLIDILDAERQKLASERMATMIADIPEYQTSKRRGRGNFQHFLKNE